MSMTSIPVKLRSSPIDLSTVDGPKMALAPELLAACERKEYRVSGLRPMELRVGFDERVAAWLDACDAYLAVVITAWNPFGRQLSSEENDVRQRELMFAVEGSRLRWSPAAGVDPMGEWVSEEGICVFDPPLILIDEWLRVFEQSAVLQGSGSGYVRLRLHPQFRPPA
ncbi:MAG: DUF3293 domain-containing protein [Burkholderiales bacterium]|jgi:hypothetical protein|nr:DUF3293 domain-containing protein [Burkholderiales bacterium]